MITDPYIYFTDGGDSGHVTDGAGKIKRVNVIGSQVVDVLHPIPGSSRPRGIAIDQKNGHIYWNLWGPARIIVVRPEPGYAANPGNDGWGTVLFEVFTR